MNIRSLTMCCGIVVLIVLSRAPLAAKESTVRDYLEWIGNKYDVYFTIEQFGKIERKHNLTVVSDYGNLEKMLKHSEGESNLSDHLNAICSVAKVEYEINRKNKRIIHIRDIQIKNEEGYPLDSKVTKFSFSQTPGVLAGALKNMGVRIDNSDTALPLGNDFKNLISIRAQEQEVRDVLSNYLPLHTYQRVLWGTLYDARDKSVRIMFYPRALDVAELNSTQMPKFIGGRNEFEAEIARRRAVITSCMNALEMSNPADASDQTRWAILLLGEYRSVESIEVLIKHMQYQYTDIDDYFEAYPAIRSLCSIGEPVVDPILKSILAGKENTALKRKLSVMILSKICGSGLNQKLADFISRTKDISQERLDALKSEIANILMKQ